MRWQEFHAITVLFPTDAKFLQAFEDEIVGMFSVVSFMSRRRSELFHMKPSQCSMSISRLHYSGLSHRRKLVQVTKSVAHWSNVSSCIFVSWASVCLGHLCAAGPHRRGTDFASLPTVSLAWHVHHRETLPGVVPTLGNNSSGLLHTDAHQSRGKSFLGL